MGSVAGALFGGGGSGVNFRAQAPDIMKPATVAQANEQYTQAQDALAQQNAFVQQVQAQNGLQNQSSVFNQLQGVANGTGPNPAQAMLNQQTGQNVANQAALMAGQRGSSANVGLMARQAGQQGANIQQQAVGQGATMQAQQSLGALNQMGGIAGQQAQQAQSAVQGYTGATQNEQQNILNMIQSQNNAEVGAATSQNDSNGKLANTVAGGQMALFGNLMGAAGSAMTLPGKAEGGVVRKGYDQGGPVTGSDNDVMTTAIGAMPGGIDPAVSGIGAPTKAPPGGPKSKLGQFFKSNSNMAGSNDPNQSALSRGSGQFGQAIGQGINSAITGIGNMINPPLGPAQPQMVAGGPMDATSSEPSIDMSGAVADSAPEMMAAKGGKVPAMVSPGERYLSPKEAQEVKKGKKDPLKAGEKIPGTPKHPGNDYRNDVVPKTLEEGGLVIPNSVMQSKHPHWEAHKFVMAHMKQEALKKGKK